MKKVRITNISNEVFIGETVIADNVLTRVKGLLGTTSLPNYSGLMIKPCKQIHTLGMNYPISVWYVANDLRVIAIIDTFPPWRISPLLKNSNVVLEFPNKWGSITTTKPGDVLEFEWYCQ